MSVAVNRRPDLPPRRRVREEARDALAVIGFSAAASVLFALALTTILAWVG